MVLSVVTRAIRFQAFALNKHYKSLVSAKTLEVPFSMRATLLPPTPQCAVHVAWRSWPGARLAFELGLNVESQRKMPSIA
eukprot:SAG11_NODE_12939_length_678_cov_0.697755_2_plen_79_part_01